MADLIHLLNRAADVVRRFETIQNFMSSCEGFCNDPEMTIKWNCGQGLPGYEVVRSDLHALLEERFPLLMRELLENAGRHKECALADLERELALRRQPVTEEGDR